MATAYLDAFSGLSGDMMVGALLDLGLDSEALKSMLRSLPLDGYDVSIESTTSSGISAVKFKVEVTGTQPERNAAEICAIIDQGDMSDKVRRQSRRVVELIAEAEAKVHRTVVDEVHFHEVGAVDSIIDVVAAVWAVHELELSELFVSRVPAGTGLVLSRHGPLPVPAPATIELMAGFPLALGGGDGEMVTPTGAALLRALAQPAPALMDFIPQRVGYGAGSRRLADRPNLLRIIVGTRGRALDADEMIELAANIDDQNPQLYEHVTERLFAAGARDVTLTPTIMKKGRPGVVLAVLAEYSQRDALADIIFTETSSIGLRIHPVTRLKLPRSMCAVDTMYGRIRVKVSGAAANPATISPEYEDCRRNALKYNVPLKLVMEQAVAAARLGNWVDETEVAQVGR